MWTNGKITLLTTLFQLSRWHMLALNLLTSMIYSTHYNVTFCYFMDNIFLLLVWSTTGMFKLFRLYKSIYCQVLPPTIPVIIGWWVVSCGWHQTLVLPFSLLHCVSHYAELITDLTGPKHFLTACNKNNKYKCTNITNYRNVIITNEVCRI